MFRVKVTIKLKKGVSDPEGLNTIKALHLLGFNNVIEAKTIKIFDLKLNNKDKKNIRSDVEKMCQRLLTNPVIHDYEIEIIGD